jgi:hypothetical protein
MAHRRERTTTRTRRSRWLGLGIVSLALCAWLAFEWARPKNEPLPAVAAGSALQTPSAGRSVDLVDPDRDLPERAAVAPVETAPTSSAAPCRILVRGTVVGSVTDLETVHLGIFGGCHLKPESGTIGRPSIEVQVDPTGRFQADVTELVEKCPDTRDLLVVARHRLSKPAALSFQPRTSVGAEQITSATPGEVVTEVTLTLELGALIHGRVTVQSAEPHAPAALMLRKRESFQQTVTSHSRRQVTAAQKWAREEGLPPWTFVMEQRARSLDDDAEFELQVEPGARYAVVAAVAGFRPQTALVDVVVEGSYRADLTILAGDQIAGTLQLGPELAPEGTQLLARLQGPDTPVDALHSEFGEMTWIDGAFEWSRVLASTDAKGSFAFRGLAPQRYELSAVCEGAPRQFVRANALGVFASPEAGLRLGPCLTRVELDLGPTQGAPIAFELKPLDQRTAFKLGPFETDASGLATLHLRPQASYEVRAAGSLVGCVRTQSAGEASSWRRPR